MNRQEFAKITMALRTYYPRENLIPNQQAADLWFVQLQDIDYAVAELAVSKWVSTNKWSPTIADLRETVVGLKQEPEAWSTGWEQVIKAIGNYGTYRVDEALASMDEITRETCKRIGFVNICMSENITADRASFRDIYKQIEARRRTEAQMPAQLKTLIDNQRAKMITAEGE